MQGQKRANNPKRETLEPHRVEENCEWLLAPALASPSTLNTPPHTLNCTAFAIASAVDNIVPKGPGPRAV